MSRGVARAVGMSSARGAGQTVPGFSLEVSPEIPLPLRLGIEELEERDWFPAVEKCPGLLSGPRFSCICYVRAQYNVSIAV